MNYIKSWVSVSAQDIRRAMEARKCSSNVEVTMCLSQWRPLLNKYFYLVQIWDAPLHGDICGYIWGKTKIRIEIPMENERNRQTYFGALNYQNQEFTIESHPSGNGESTIKFMKHLQDKYAGSKIILIWNGASYHRFGEFRDFLEKVNHGIPSSDWSITCILFAPNALEQNPVEDVWLQAKNFLREYWHLCRSFKAIKILFELFTSEQKFDFPKVHLYQSTEQLI